MLLMDQKEKKEKQRLFTFSGAVLISSFLLVFVPSVCLPLVSFGSSLFQIDYESFLFFPSK